MRDVADDELPLTRIKEFEEWLDGDITLDELFECPAFYDEGREYTYDDWDPHPGMVIKRTLDVLLPKPKKMRPATREDSAGAVYFGTFEQPAPSNIGSVAAAVTKV
jgi:hypothetical protein